MTLQTFFPRIAAATFVASALLFLASACSKQDRDTAGAKARDAYDRASEATKDAYADTKAAMGKAWDEMKAYTFEQRERFAASAKAMESNMEVQASRLRAEQAEAEASASRQAAMAELKNAQADYKQKVAALGDATAATWESAKQNVIVAWNRMEAAYHNARAK
ncbi:hypothetical protein [Opitutus terrae]|uniref:Lipoprotein n=1 Tax=Opitutus terrae (strain DSM 11246 / JCM 15787 / PB90-1) TaxID=452637 RepID=B1ZWY6_OPITP|nr:hypothetical protein [Opitutus terrae]ACB75097.1 hypothetical protein Oter_1813 [Opitutus terrae PB90-1]